MGIITDILAGIDLPNMIRVRQNFVAPETRDVAAALREEIRRPEIASRVKPRNETLPLVSEAGASWRRIYGRVDRKRDHR